MTGAHDPGLHGKWRIRALTFSITAERSTGMPGRGLPRQRNAALRCLGDQCWQIRTVSSDAGPCDAVVPTESVPTLNEWGVIIFMMLAGLGSVYYLRKYRRV